MANKKLSTVNTISKNDSKYVIVISDEASTGKHEGVFKVDVSEFNESNYEISEIRMLSTNKFNTLPNHDDYLLCDGSQYDGDVGGVYEELGSLLGKQSLITCEDFTQKINVNGNIRAVDIDGTNIIIGGEEGGLYLSTDNGDSFTDINPNIPALGTSRVNSVYIEGDNIFVAANTSKIYMSTNLGVSFVDLALNIPAPGLSGNVNSVDVDGTNIIISTTSDIYLSEDSGVTFNNVYNGSNIIKTRIHGNNIITIGQTGMLLLSEDLGDSFNDIKVNVPGIGNTTMQTVSIENNIIIIAGDGGKIYMSEDLGNTFVDIKPLLIGIDSNVIYSSYIDNNVFVIGTQNGNVYLSENFGTNFENIKDKLLGLGTNSVRGISFYNDNIVIGGNNNNAYMAKKILDFILPNIQPNMGVSSYIKAK